MTSYVREIPRIPCETPVLALSPLINYYAYNGSRLNRFQDLCGACVTISQVT